MVLACGPRRPFFVHYLLHGGSRKLFLPGLTDDRESIEILLAALAGAGAETIAASALFLRPALSSSLKYALPSDQGGSLIGRLVEQQPHGPGYVRKAATAHSACSC